MKIKEVRIVPADIPVWSVNMQQNIVFQQPVSVIITGTCIGSSLIFASLVNSPKEEILFNYDKSKNS